MPRVPRRGQRYADLPKSAFGPHKFENIKGQITTIKRNVEAHMDKNDLTHMDILNGFVREEHRVVLVKARELTTISIYERSAFNTKLSTHNVYVHLAVPPFLLPHYMHVTPCMSCEVAEKIERWLAWAVPHEDGFSLLQYVVEDLNVLCANPQQVRFYFKGIVTLMGMAGYLAEASQLEEFKAPRELPNIPRELRDAANEANAFLARMMLYPRKKEEQGKTRDVSLSLSEHRTSRTWKKP